MTESSQQKQDSNTTNNPTNRSNEKNENSNDAKEEKDKNDESSKSKITPEKLEKMKRNRERVMDEILNTEETYVNMMNIMNTHYIKPMSEKFPSLFSMSAFELFRSIDIIIQVNDKLLKDLQEYISGTSKLPLGIIFMQLAPFLKTYTDYINSYEEVFSEVEKLRENHSKFSHFLDKAEASPDVNHHTLISFLILPVQRIPRYNMLLAELIKNTEESHPDYKQLVSALAKTREVADRVNKRVHEAENKHKLLEIDRILNNKPKDFELIEASRKYDFEGDLVKISSSAVQLRHFFLFDDILVYGKEISDDDPKYPNNNNNSKDNKSSVTTAHHAGRNDRYQFSGYIPFKPPLPWIKDIPDSKYLQNTFQVVGSTKTLTLVAPDSAAKDSWTSAISSHISNLIDNFPHLLSWPYASPSWETETRFFSILPSSSSTESKNTDDNNNNNQSNDTHSNPWPVPPHRVMFSGAAETFRSRRGRDAWLCYGRAAGDYRGNAERDELTFEEGDGFYVYYHGSDRWGLAVPEEVYDACYDDEEWMRMDENENNDNNNDTQYDHKTDNNNNNNDHINNNDNNNNNNDNNNNENDNVNNNNKTTDHYNDNNNEIENHEMNIVDTESNKDDSKDIQRTSTSSSLSLWLYKMPSKSSSLSLIYIPPSLSSYILTPSSSKSSSSSSSSSCKPLIGLVPLNYIDRLRVNPKPPQKQKKVPSSSLVSSSSSSEKNYSNDGSNNNNNNNNNNKNKETVNSKSLPNQTPIAIQVTDYSDDDEYQNQYDQTNNSQDSGALMSPDSRQQNVDQYDSGSDIATPSRSHLSSEHHRHYNMHDDAFVIENAYYSEVPYFSDVQARWDKLPDWMQSQMAKWVFESMENVLAPTLRSTLDVGSSSKSGKGNKHDTALQHEDDVVSDSDSLVLDGGDEEVVHINRAWFIEDLPSVVQFSMESTPIPFPDDSKKDSSKQGSKKRKSWRKSLTFNRFKRRSRRQSESPNTLTPDSPPKRNRLSLRPKSMSARFLGGLSAADETEKEPIPKEGRSNRLSFVKNFSNVFKKKRRKSEPK